MLLALTVITGIIVSSGYFYYREINRSEDPRILGAREKMAEYSRLMGENDFGMALFSLDQAESIYVNTPGYADSYETGVIQNDRGTVFLIMAETDILNKKEADPQNLIMAKQSVQRGIDIYTKWVDRITDLTRDQIRQMVLPHFSDSDPAFTGFNLNRILEKRVDDIILSKIETKRRLSVSYTNLGIVSRYEGSLEKAKLNYEKALELWSENHVAKNNLNRLLGLPYEKRNIIQQLFYKERAETN